MIKKLISLFAVTACLALVVAAPVMAQSPTADAYSGVAGQLQGGSGDDGSGSDPAAATSNGDDSGNLPFTGFELGLAVAIGAGLLGTGLVLRRGLRTKTSLS